MKASQIPESAETTISTPFTDLSEPKDDDEDSEIVVISVTVVFGIIILFSVALMLVHCCKRITDHSRPQPGRILLIKFVAITI